MSSDVESTVQLLFLNNDVSLATLTVVVYDYILMFPSEVEYIWNKPWTWVTMLYLIVRYAGIYYAVKTSFYGSTFVPGPVKSGVSTVNPRPWRCLISISCFTSKGVGFAYSGDWVYAAFACAISLLMVLRIHAIWNRSKVILTILLLCYAARVAFELVLTIIFENPDIDATVGTIQVLDYSLCTEVYPAINPYVKYVVIWPILFDALLLILALVPLAKQSIAMYKAMGLWEPNRYMTLIVKEGVAYVLLNLLNNIPLAITNYDAQLSTVWYLIISFLYIITLLPIAPRFVISMRELFDKDTRGRLEGIDSVFGISSRPGNVVGRDSASVSAIAFTDGSSHPGPGEDGGEEIHLEVA